MPQLLPVGTQVVVLAEARAEHGRVVHGRGAIGVVVQGPSDYWHSYRVRFFDGFEAAFARRELAVLSHFKEGAASQSLDELRLQDRVIYRCVIGSRAYGLDDADSDTDRRGIYLPTAEQHWSLYGIPEQMENPATEETYWELQKFLTLALKANPNVLECLYTPIVELATPDVQRLLAMRQLFLSKLIFQTYNGYVFSQFKKLQGDLRNKGAVKWKHVMHLLRLLLSGITAMREGVVPVHVGSHRDQLLAVKRGEVSFEECERWRLSLQKEFEAAFDQSPLPERPDYAAANKYLIKMRRSAL